MAVKLNSTGGGSVTLDSPSTASNYTVTLPSAAGTLATTTGTGSVFTNPTINGFTGDTSAITIGTTQFVKDTSGNIGIGTASPGYKLTVAGGNGNAITYLGATNTAALGCIGATPYVGALSNSNFSFVTNATVQATLDASGNLGLGVTPSAYLSAVPAIQLGQISVLSQDVNSFYLNANASAPYGRYLRTGSYAVSYHLDSAVGSHKWFNSNGVTGTAGNTISPNQAMTLDASGNLIVGDTSGTGQRIYAKSATADGTTYATVLRNSASTLLLYVRSDGYISTGTAAASPYNNTSGSAANLYVDAGGLLYRSTSSARYKNSIADAVHGLAEVLKLRPVTFNGNNDGDIVFGGLIAEEVHDAGLTEFVQYNDDGEPDALAYGNMVSLAFKAIQELSAQNNALEARLAQLEAK